MQGMGFEQIQNMSQIQTQRMSQQQIQSMKMLGMNVFDLRKEIYKEIEKNPALEIKNDPLVSGVQNVKKITNSHTDYTRLGNSSAAGEEASENFQQMLENAIDTRESLQEHLLSQLYVMHISDIEKQTGEKLIYNLDNHGHHILAPVSLFDKFNSSFNQLILNKMIKIIQFFDPVGTCCSNVEESLCIQAQFKILEIQKESQKLPEHLIYFILNGHLDFLNPPLPDKIKRKIDKFILSYNNLKFTPSFSGEGKDFLSELIKTNVAISDIEQALNFIKGLNPYPAASYGWTRISYVTPDVYVKKVPADLVDYEKKNLVQTKDGVTFRIIFAKNNLPDLSISSDFIRYEVSNKNKRIDKEKKFISSSLKTAKTFISNLEFREATIVTASEQIVKYQIDFFMRGPRYLVPLREKDIAELIGVHESTISRMANSKYIQCDWGLFPVKYFFSNSIDMSFVSKNSSDVNKNSKSKESVKFEIAEILKEHAGDKKRLSDQKISDILLERHIKIARRTVAKYRNELNIASSFDR